MPKKVFLLLAPNIVLLIALIYEVGLACEFIFSYLVYFGLVIICIITTLIGLSIGIRAKQNRVRIIVIFSGVILCCMFLPVLVRMRQTLEFRLRQPGYIQVINLVHQGKIIPKGNYGLVDNEHEYLLPCGKDFAIEENSRGLFVLFFTSKRFLGEFAGYMYISDGQPPTIEQFRGLRSLSPDYWSYIEQADKNWYYVVWDH